MSEVLDRPAFLAVQQHLPGLSERLAELSLAELESPSSLGIRAFKEAGGPGLLIPESYGGGGLSALEAMRVQRGLGRLAPSAAVATTMHQFSIATLVEITNIRPGMEWLVIESVARQNLLIASGFAEGSVGGQVLRPMMQVEPVRGGHRISGTKKPCSLSGSMDMIAVSLLVDEGGIEQFAVALVSAKDPGIEVKPYWRSSVLGGAETGEVVLRDVSVPAAVMTCAGPPDQLDAVQLRGYLWFQLLICSAYIGITTRLVSLALRTAGPAGHRMLDAIAELETAIAALECVGQAFMGSVEDEKELLVRTVLVRRGVEDALIRAGDIAFRLVGARSFAGSSDAAVLLASSRALAWHPPSRERAYDSLTSHLAGHGLTAF